MRARGSRFHLQLHALVACLGAAARGRGRLDRGAQPDRRAGRHGCRSAAVAARSQPRRSAAIAACRRSCRAGPTAQARARRMPTETPSPRERGEGGARLAGMQERPAQHDRSQNVVEDARVLVERFRQIPIRRKRHALAQPRATGMIRHFDDDRLAMRQSGLGCFERRFERQPDAVQRDARHLDAGRSAARGATRSIFPMPVRGNSSSTHTCLAGTASTGAAPSWCERTTPADGSSGMRADPPASALASAARSGSPSDAARALSRARRTQQAVFPSGRRARRTRGRRIPRPRAAASP